jgi:hypothetical protein
LEPKTSYINLFLGAIRHSRGSSASSFDVVEETYYFGAAFKIVFQNAVE